MVLRRCFRPDVLLFTLWLAALLVGLGLHVRLLVLDMSYVLLHTFLSQPVVNEVLLLRLALFGQHFLNAHLLETHILVLLANDALGLRKEAPPCQLQFFTHAVDKNRFVYHLGAWLQNFEFEGVSVFLIG